jgi:hypothetical protein
MTQCLDLMVDVECLGTSNNAAMVSIGAVFFDLATETIGASFTKNIHLATAVRDGGTMDAATVLWWLKQSDAAKGRVFQGAIDIKEVLHDLAIWIGNNCPDKNVRPWGNSARFDLGILSSAFERNHTPVPWKWRNERCFRTVRNLNPQVPYTPSEKGDGAHDPTVDCRFQIQHLFSVKRYRNGDLF